MKIFNLPDLGEGLPDAEIHEWHVKEGDTVKTGDVLVSVETAKAIVDVPAPYNGRVTKLYGKPGDILKTGSPLVGFEGAEDAGSVVGHLETTNIVLPPISPTSASSSSETIKILPAARALAKKLNVDINQIHPSGAQGQITVEDVEHAHSHQQGMELVKGPRRMMAIAMAQAHAEVVPVTIVDDADIHHWPEKTDITVRIIRAMIAACQAEPSLNAWFDGKAIARRLLTDIHVGIAMDSPEGLFVPVLRAVQNASDAELRSRIDTFKAQIKTRTISPEDLRGSSIMLSNFGTFAGRYATPILLPPAVAILGVGRVHEGKLPLSLTCDHRAVTGGEAARFLAVLIQGLQH